MFAVIYGAIGTIAVLLLLAVGIVLGWKGARYSRTKWQTESQEENRHRLETEQRAFETMLHYNSDTAYGQYDASVTMGGDEE